MRDGEGQFWVVRPGEDAWQRRELFQPTGESQLEAIPGRYIHMLGLPTS